MHLVYHSFKSGIEGPMSSQVERETSAYLAKDANAG